MDMNFLEQGSFFCMLEDAFRQEGSRDERSALSDLEQELSTRRGVSKKHWSIVARAVCQYLEEHHGQIRNARFDMRCYLFLARTRLAIHSVPLQQAMISYVDEYFEGKRMVMGYAIVDLITLIVGEAETKRLQYYCIHEAPGSAILKSRKRVVSYKVHPWALEAAKRWLPLVRAGARSLIDQSRWSLLMRLYRVLPNEIYSEAEYLEDFQRISSGHPEWSSQKRLWMLHCLRPEPDWLYRVGRLSETGRDTMKSFFVPLAEKTA